MPRFRKPSRRKSRSYNQPRRSSPAAAGKLRGIGPIANEILQKATKRTKNVEYSSALCFLRCLLFKQNHATRTHPLPPSPPPRFRRH